MINKWDNSQKFNNELDACIYASQLLGAEPALILHGGGNSSVKILVQSIFGAKEPCLYVKGSGKDMRVATTSDFCPLNLTGLQRFKSLAELDDFEMIKQLILHKLNPDSPAPSVETFVHAFLPHKVILHTHSEAVLALTNQENPELILDRIYQGDVGIVSYSMAGLKLAQIIAEHHRQYPEQKAIIALNHGVFTFGETCKEAYDIMIDIVNRAEKVMFEDARSKNIDFHAKNITDDQENLALKLLPIMKGKYPSFHFSCKNIENLSKHLNQTQVQEICTNGVITTDHAIRTKNMYLFFSDIPVEADSLPDYINLELERFSANYSEYIKRNKSDLNIDEIGFDLLPRILICSNGLLIACGKTRELALASADIAEQSIKTKMLANSIGRYKPIDEKHIFAMEFWTLQQNKLKADRLPLEGQIALVTGAGGVIGYGIADKLLQAGACVVLADINAQRLSTVKDILLEDYNANKILAVEMDVTSFESVQNAYVETCLHFGGIDIVVPNAGMAHVANLEVLETEKFKKVIEVNQVGTFHVIKGAIPYLKAQNYGGNIVCISSKNVFAPGAAFGAYSSSKAGAHQLGRIASLELAPINVRVNMVNPDGVFGNEKVSSGLWDVVGPDRMKSRNLDPDGLKEYYRNRNLLKVSVSAEHVGNAVVFFASNLTPTTGATLPVDGGVAEAAPR